MNKLRVLELADVIERVPHVASPIDDGTPRTLSLSGFNMGEWHCGSVGDIDGWCRATFKDSDSVGTLGVSFDTFWRLCCPSVIDRDKWTSITPDQAACTLRHLAETGEVDWPHVTASPPAHASSQNPEPVQG